MNGAVLVTWATNMADSFTFGSSFVVVPVKSTAHHHERQDRQHEPHGAECDPE